MRLQGRHREHLLVMEEGPPRVGEFIRLRARAEPVLLCVADSAQRAAWLFEHLTRDYQLLRNPDEEERACWVTIQIDSKVFDADKGNEAVLREMEHRRVQGKVRRRGAMHR